MRAPASPFWLHPNTAQGPPMSTLKLPRITSAEVLFAYGVGILVLLIL